MENKTNAILEGLNDEQKNAVSCVDGPVLIVAGAGSGKTRVLTSRIAYILENGCEPERILALTFTKKAAQEMKERIAMMAGPQRARKIQMGTFHSVFIRFLRDYADSIGYPQSFTIWDQSDSTTAIKAIIKELGLDDKVYKPKDVQSRISEAKNNLVTAAAYKSNSVAQTKDAASKKPRICDIYINYAARAKQAGVMDFDDILLNMNVLLRDNPAAVKEISDRFSYILVDEYQDTNLAQYIILRRLTQAHHNICVVGDDSQSIYAFRGARIENILNFRKDFPESKIFRLEKNYRSTQMIVDAANSLIEKNAGRIPKTCRAVGETGEKIHLLKAYTEQEEALMIASSIIAKMRDEHAQYQDFAILYRTNSQSRALEEALRKRNLPYVVYSGHSFFERAEVKDAMAYFKLVCNINDDEAFKRAINKPPRGIGDTSLQALSRAASGMGPDGAHEGAPMSLFKTAYREDLERFGLKNAGIQKIRQFCDMINGFAIRALHEDAYEIAAAIMNDSGLYASFKMDNSVEGQSRAANEDELVNSVKQYVEDKQEEQRDALMQDAMEEGSSSDSVDYVVDDADLSTVTLADFLEGISLLSTVDLEDEEDSANRITLMTVHSSKGLEFPHVFVAGMEENLFPSGSMTVSANDVEEERRLFYVAVTRAKKTVDLTFAQTRMRNGKHENNAPSRFIREIDSRFIANPLHEDEFEAAEQEVDEIGFPLWARKRQQGFSGARQRPEQAHRPSFSRPAAPKPVAPKPIVPKPILPKPVPAAPQKLDLNFQPEDISVFRAGQRILHNRFGSGKILELSGTYPDIKAKVAFDAYGEKILLLKFAKMKREVE